MRSLFRSLMTSLMVSALATFGFHVAPVNAQSQQPLQWNYMMNDSNISVARYPSLATATQNNYSGLTAGYGDSLTRGSQDQSTITWPNQLIGAAALNYGISGQTSGEIAVRMNAFRGHVQQQFPNSFTVPTSGTVGLNFVVNYEACLNSGVTGSATVHLQFNAPDGTAFTGACVFDGTNYNFTPDTYPASPEVIPGGTQYTVNTGNSLLGCVIIEAGRNDVTNGLSTSTLLFNISQMVAAVQINSGCYAVTDVINGEGEGTGTTNYNTIVALNQQIASIYTPGDHYIAWRKPLVSTFNTSNPADVIDHTNDVPPYSLRAASDIGTASIISSTTTCAITFSGGAAVPGEIVTIDSEKINLTGGTNGAWTCIRGYASTTPATHAAAAPYVGVDWLHLGENSSSPSNSATNSTNGYIVTGTLFSNWLSNFGYHNLLAKGSSLQTAQQYQNMFRITTGSGIINPLNAPIAVPKIRFYDSTNKQYATVSNYNEITVNGQGLVFDTPVISPASAANGLSFGTNTLQIAAMNIKGFINFYQSSGASTPSVSVRTAFGTSIDVNAPVRPTTIYSAAGTPLPTCNANMKGAVTAVSDATTPTFLGAYASGGAVVSPVFCNGTGWVTG